MESGPTSAGYVAERIDEQDTQSHEWVSVGTATVAMILHGLGVSNRRLYLAPQFFATKPVERLLGPGISSASQAPTRERWVVVRTTQGEEPTYE